MVTETKLEVEEIHAGGGSWIVVTKKEYSADDVRNKYVQYAYDIWGMDLVTLIECENANWDMYRQSNVVKNWKREQSYWFCQISRVYHPEIVDTKIFWADPYWQLDRCNELMRWGTVFYGRDRKVKWMKCSSYVLDRFSIVNG